LNWRTSMVHDPLVAQTPSADMAFAEDRPARHSQHSRNHASRGHHISWLQWFAIRCGLSVWPPPVRIRPGFPIQRGFYIQAFDGSVALPAAGYDYNSDWTPLLAGLSPAKMAASLAAPVPVMWARMRTRSINRPLRYRSAMGALDPHKLVAGYKR
jgi:hypothetical protein